MKRFTGIIAVTAAGLLASCPIGTCQGQTAPGSSCPMNNARPHAPIRILYLEDEAP